MFRRDARFEREGAVRGEAVAATVQLRDPHDDELLRREVDGAHVEDLTEEGQQCFEEIRRVCK